MAKQKQVTKESNTEKRAYRQRPFPSFSLEASLIIARSISENNACKPYSRLSLAESIDRSPESSAFRNLITSSSSYGLTTGGYQAAYIQLTELGLAIVAPKSDDERNAALIKATFNIELFKKLYEHFNQHKIPPHEHFKNTLIRDYKLETSLADECINLFKADGKYVGLIRHIAGADRVSIHDASSLPVISVETKEESKEDNLPDNLYADVTKPVQPEVVHNTRVFITHGKNREIVNQLKDLLTFGRFHPVVAQEHETTSRPVPEKVLDDMRSCFAGIINVTSEEELLDTAGNIHHKINENVLIEIGAAMALYKNNFILLVQRGIHLPSNLQGLYRCEYDGEKLDYEATMKLLKAFNEFK
jgi:predicted nucleotide-binding protein